MAGVTDIVGNWLQGNNITDVTGNAGGNDDGSVLEASDSTTDSEASDSEGDIQAEGQGSVDGKEDSGKVADGNKTKTSPGDRETITISDDKGRRKVEIDYTNKDQVKKYVQMAYGARKWQAERDQARAEVEPLRSQLSEMRTNWDTLESAFQRSGIEGVVDLLEGKQGAYKAHMGKAMERAEFIKRASPEELEALEARETAHTKASEAERLRKELDEFKAKVEADRNAADTSAVESRIHPVFDKYRFADKLGDSSDEAMFDEMLWKTAMSRLEPYEDQYGSASAIPGELIDKEFRTVSQSIRKRMAVQAEKRAGKVIEQKKQEATENVQAKVQSGYQTGGVRKEADKMIQDRNLTGLLKNWGKYGSAFGKK